MTARTESAQVASRQKLLIACGNPYVFAESLVPLLRPLALRFDVHLMLVDYFLSPRILDAVNQAMREGTVQRRWIVPEYDRTFGLHMFMWKHLHELRSMEYDALLSLSMMQVFERYVVEAVLPPNATKVCFFPSTTYLLEREEVVRRLLDGHHVPREMLERPSGQLGPFEILRRGIGLFAREPSGRRLLSAGKYMLLGGGAQLRLRGRSLVDRVLLPRMVCGKTFRLRQHDWLTQIGTDQFDAVIFCDPVEARAHGALFAMDAVFVARHPSEGECRCDGGDGPQRTVLSPLAGLVGQDDVSAPAIEGYARDLRTAVLESGATALHLRLHPRETGKWPEKLRLLLRARGVDARLVKAERPLREIVCDYLGVVGPASSSLRDARAACDHAFVVALSGVSRQFFKNPKFVMGEGIGLGWVEEDGRFSPETFNRRPCHRGPYKTVPEILDALVRMPRPWQGRRGQERGA